MNANNRENSPHTFDGPRKAALVLTVEFAVVIAGLIYSFLTNSDQLFQLFVLIGLLLSIPTFYLTYKFDSI